MFKFYWCCFFFIFYHVNADFYKFKDEENQCIVVCTDSFFLLPMVPDAGNACERGCRFFNIIYLTYGLDINSTRQQCYFSCKEAYSPQNENACITGCNATSIKKEVDLRNILTFIGKDSTRHFLLETEIQILESNILSDPTIKNQIQLGYDLEYKIPETKIRTMPIAEILERRIIESKSQASGDWLDCASRNSGIPKSILAIAILLAIVVVFILLIASARDRALENLIGEMNTVERDEYVVDVEYGVEKKDNFPSVNENNDDTAKLVENEINFSKPPKYQSETEKV